MAAKVGSVSGDSNVMAELGRDLAVAARTDIGLERLIGLDSTHFDRPVEAVPYPWLRGPFLGSHRKTGHSAGKGPKDQSEGRNDGRRHKDVVRLSGNEFPIRVESHGTHYRRWGDDIGAFLRTRFKSKSAVSDH